MGITDIPYHMVFKWLIAKLIFCRFLYLILESIQIRENTFDIQLILHDNSRVYLNNFFILARVSLFKSIKPTYPKTKSLQNRHIFLKFFGHVI